MPLDHAVWSAQRDVPPTERDPVERATRITLIAVAAGTLVGMFVYECAKQFILPKVTIWQSHAITIVFSTVVATIGAYFALRRQQKLHLRVLEESRRRKSIEEIVLQLAAIVDCSNDAIIGHDAWWCHLHLE